MKNREKWADKLIKLLMKGETIAVDLHTHKPCACEGMCCMDCLFGVSEEAECEDLRLKWLENEAEYNSTDWSKVKVDTQILVSDNNQDWERRHFAEFKNGKVYCWTNGKTSWSTHNDKNNYAISWPYVKLWEEDEDDE